MKLFIRKFFTLVTCFTLGVFLFCGLLGCISSTINLDESSMAAYKRFEKAYRGYHTTGGAKQLHHFQEAFSRVRLEYVHPVSDDRLIDNAIKGLNAEAIKESEHTSQALIEAALDSMMATLDKYSIYLNPDEYRAIELATQGKFSGIGILIARDKRSNLIKVTSLLDDTPAFHAGIKVDDLISHLNGNSVKDLPLDIIVRRIRGRPNTNIRLTLKREGCHSFDLMLIRDIIHIQAVKWQLEHDVGYIRVTSFVETVEQDIAEAMEDLHDKAGSKLKGVILDLRNNPGGLLGQAITLSDSFLNYGDIVSVRGRDPAHTRRYTAKSGDLANGLPLIILINGRSASSSEIVAAALQENGRAIVMGTPSFGKESIQVIEGLTLEGGLKITTHLYYIPSGRAIQSIGIVPDVFLKPQKEFRNKRDANFPQAVKVNKDKKIPTWITINEEACPSAGKQGKDKVLGCALSYIRAANPAAFLSQIGVAVY